MSLEQPPARSTKPLTDDGIFSHYWSRWFTSVWNTLSPGTNGSFQSLDGKTVTVQNGIVTKIS